MATKREVIWSDATPTPFKVMQFSLAVKFNGMDYLSGNIGVDARTNKLIEGSIRQCATVIMQNIAAVLKDAGSDLSKIVQVTVFRTDMKNDLDPMNEAYLEFFPDLKELHARTCVQAAALPSGTDVEVDCIAPTVMLWANLNYCRCRV